MKTTKQYGRKADTALSLWVKLVRATSTFSHKTAENIRSFGLTTPQFGVLETLGHLGPMFMGELTKKQLMSGGNTTVVVNNLVKRGLVERLVCKEDRRAFYIQLTPKGKKLFKQIFPKHATYVAQTASVLSDAEQKALSVLLKKLGTGIK
jgi:MarR family 2-MHQ and catechol resistance regulon transcriptional repressor